MTHFLLGNGFMAVIWLWSVIASPSRPEIAKQEVEKVSFIYSKFPDWNEDKATAFNLVCSILKTME